MATQGERAQRLGSRRSTYIVLSSMCSTRLFPCCSRWLSSLSFLALVILVFPFPFLDQSDLSPPLLPLFRQGATALDLDQQVQAGGAGRRVRATIGPARAAARICRGRCAPLLRHRSRLEALFFSSLLLFCFCVCFHLRVRARAFVTCICRYYDVLDGPASFANDIALLCFSFVICTLPFLGWPALSEQAARLTLPRTSTASSRRTPPRAR